MTVAFDWALQIGADPAIMQLLRPPTYTPWTRRSGQAVPQPGDPTSTAGTLTRLAGIDVARCHQWHVSALLYVGISPHKPPTNGRAPSKSHVHQRLRSHFRGNAAGSRLWLTLGCLLEQEIGTVTRRVGNGGTLTFTNPGEQLLDRWLLAHGRVA